MRWHLVKPLKSDNVRLALDSAKDDFLWCPYVQYADKCGIFYPEIETSVPLMKDLDIGLKKKKGDLDKKNYLICYVLESFRASWI